MSLFFGRNRGTKLYKLEDENIVSKFINRGTWEHGAILEGNRDPLGRFTIYDRHYAGQVLSPLCYKSFWRVPRVLWALQCDFNSTWFKGPFSALMHCAPWYFELPNSSKQASIAFSQSNPWNIVLSYSLAVNTFSYCHFCSEGDWVPFSAMSWAWMKVGSNFGFPSGLRAK